VRAPVGARTVAARAGCENEPYGPSDGSKMVRISPGLVSRSTLRPRGRAGRRSRLINSLQWSRRSGSRGLPGAYGKGRQDRQRRDSGRHHPGMPSDIISDRPGDFVGIRSVAYGRLARRERGLALLALCQTPRTASASRY
jgi:hypothetical protein